MKELIEVIAADLAGALDYLRWATAIDNPVLPPDGVEYPGVGIKDGAQLFESEPGKRDRETLTIHLYAYQSLALGTPGASLMGSAPEQGPGFAGLIDIAKDIRARLNDQFFSAALGGKIYFAHCDEIAESETIEQGESYLQFKKITMRYRRRS